MHKLKKFEKFNLQIRKPRLTQQAIVYFVIFWEK